jgi:chromosome segregation ATPase
VAEGVKKEQSSFFHNLAACRLSTALIVREAVSVVLSSQLVDSERVRSCLSQICATQGEFDRFFSEVFDQLDALSGQLLRREHAWQNEQKEAEAALRRRAAQLEAERAAFAAEREQVRGNSESARAALDSTADDQLRQILETVEQERASLRSALEETRERAAELARVAGELNEARRGIEEARASAEAVASRGDGELRQQLAELQRDRENLYHERAALEAELESVRNRAAEMAEALAEQKHEISEERAQWTEELKRLRRVLESLSSQRTQQPFVAEPHPPAVPGAPVAGRTATGSDPVLESVMAQFEMLQRDLARRRQHSFRPG